MSAPNSLYKILDEPLPTSRAGWATEPLWPLLALMLVGGWLAWPWFALNAFVLRSASRETELRLILGAILGSFLIHWGMLYALVELEVAARWLRYLGLALPAVRLSAGMLIYLKQRTTWEIYEAFGGQGAPGMYALIAGFLIQGRIEPLFADGFLAAALM